MPNGILPQRAALDQPLEQISCKHGVFRRRNFDERGQYSSKSRHRSVQLALGVLSLVAG
jgi:hypothetical protein